EAEYQRLKDDGEEPPGEGVDRLLVVEDVDDVVGVVPLDGHGQIHDARGDGAALPHLAVHGLEEVGGHGDRFGLVGAVEHLAVAGENVDIAAAQVDAEIRLGHQTLLHLTRAVGTHGQILKLGDKVLGEGLLHLEVELLNIVVSHAVDEEGAHHRHQCQDEEHHNHHHFGAQGSHGQTSFRERGYRRYSPQ